MVDSGFLRLDGGRQLVAHAPPPLQGGPAFPVPIGLIEQEGNQPRADDQELARPVGPKGRVGDIERQQPEQEEPDDRVVSEEGQHRPAEPPGI